MSHINKLPDAYQIHILGYPSTKLNPIQEAKIQQSLAAFGLDKVADSNEVVEIPIPPGFGSLKEEIADAVNNLTKGTIDALEAVMSWELPEMPDTFNMCLGWQRWNPKTHKWVPSVLPEGKVCFLDFETVEVDGKWLPTCAVAMTNLGWMVWVTDFRNMVSVIPYTNNNLVINFNTQYDRGFMDVEYLQEDSGNRFFDLMSAWIVSHGMTNQQRPIYKLAQKMDKPWFAPEWLSKTGTNGLSEVYKFFFGTELDKGVRDNIVNDGLSWVRLHMAEVVRYCCQDVYHTAQLFKRLYPIYLQHRPSRVAQSGSILLGCAWVPLSPERFPTYYDVVEERYQQFKEKTNEDLKAICDKYLEQKDVNNLTASDLALDWTIAKSGANKGLPLWYRQMLGKYRNGGLSLGMRFVPVVLGLTWKGEPLIWDADGESWATSNGWLPHPENQGAPVSELFAKGFVTAFEQGVLDSALDWVKPLITEKMSVVNWVALRNRVKAVHTESPEGFPVHIPQMLVNGTITGRAVDNIWLVCPNPKEKRIGTELKSMVQAPKGYVMVGADVDSQESVLAAAIGESKNGINGSTPFGYINIVGRNTGDLRTASDIHSVMARETEMTRSLTKNRVYGSLYGQGEKGDTDYLMKSIPGISPDEAKPKSRLFLRKFKGEKVYNTHTNRKRYQCGLASDAFNALEVIADGRQPRTPLLGCYLTKSLAGSKDFKPSRVNWTVQSSGVDFRDLLILLTIHFYKKLGVDGRFLITIHDEIRTIVKDTPQNITNAVHALQLAQLYVKAAFVDALGLDCIPAGYAWFSGIDIDTILRKDPSDPQITPTQPVGIFPGQVIRPHEVLAMINSSK